MASTLQRCLDRAHHASSRRRDERSSSKLWNKLTLGVEASTKNAVIICFCAAIFDLLLTQMRTLLSSESTVLSGDTGKIALCPNPLLEQQVHHSASRQVSSRGVHTFLASISLYFAHTCQCRALLVIRICVRMTKAVSAFFLGMQNSSSTTTF